MLCADESEDMTVFQLGNVLIGLSGHGPVFESVCAEIRESLPTSGGKADVTFKFVDDLRSVEYHRNGRVLVTPNGIRIDAGGIVYEVEPIICNVTLHVKMMSSRLPVPEFVSRSRDWNFLTFAETKAKDFMYNVFDWITQIVNLANGQSYIHASSMCRDHQAVAIMAWGGVGKTTTMLKLCTEGEWRFMSDDLGLIAEDGTLYRTPKRLQVYAYNLEGQSRLRNHLMGRRSLVDKAAFTYREKRFGPKKVRRRVSAEELLGPGRLADDAPLTDIIFLERSNVQDMTPKSVSTDELAERMAAIVMAEIEPYSSLAREAEAGGGKMPIPPAEIQQMTKEILKRAFTNRRAITLQVGESPTPNILAESISKYLNDVR